MSGEKQFPKYLIFVFSIAWILQVIACLCSMNGIAVGYTLILVIVMYVPFLSVLLSKVSLKEIGFMPHLKGKIRYVFAAWFVPGFLAIMGAALFFMIFPKTFDLTGSMIAATTGQDVAEVLKAQGMTYPMYMVVTTISSMTMAPWINMLAALGEEVGWRGYMYRELKDIFGKNKGRLLGGIIWGVWHWPLMFLVGYEYGKEYPGFPFVGPIVFCVFTVSVGIILDEWYEKTGCIWLPALGHGAINASTFSLYLLNVENANMQLLGPLPVGLIGGLGFLIYAILICVRKQKSVNKSAD